MCIFSRLISAKSSRIFRIFPYSFLVYSRCNARAEDLSMNVLILRISMKVLSILLFIAIFVEIYLPSTIFAIVFILLVKFGCLPVFGKNLPVFSQGKIQNLQALKIIG